MAEILLSQHKLALIDDADYALISRYTWSANAHSKTFYARAHVGTQGKTRYMHQMLLGLPAGIDCDHVNGDGLDNRRANLRPATRSQNLMNRGPQLNNTSGFKGVSRAPTKSKWRAFINSGPQFVHLGTFDTPELAAQAYDFMAFQLFGEFAYLNLSPLDYACRSQHERRSA